MNLIHARPIYTKLVTMKTKKIVTRCLLAFIVFISLYLHACEREEWCAYCQWECSFDPLTGPTSKTICAHSYRQCEDEILDFLDGRFLPDCWECTEPR
jgi:hypothetical protein